MSGKKALKHRKPRQVQRGLYSNGHHYVAKYTYCSPDVKAIWTANGGSSVKDVLYASKYDKIKKYEYLNVDDISALKHWGFLLPLEFINGGVEE